MMHPDDIKRLAIMGTLIMLCAFCPGPGRAAELQSIGPLCAFVDGIYVVPELANKVP